MEVDNQFLIDRGTRADDLIKNETFGEVYKALTDYYIEEFVNSGETDAARRESAYQGLRGAQTMLGILHQWIAMRDQIMYTLED